MAAWWGAAVATFLLFWDIIKWKKRGPRLNILIETAPRRSMRYEIAITNVGDATASIKRIELHVYTRPRLFCKREHKISEIFGLAGVDGFPPMSLAPGAFWQGSISQGRGLLHPPDLSQECILVTIEIEEAHRKKPYTFVQDNKPLLELTKKKSGAA
jgi:hypothetical protein